MNSKRFFQVILGLFVGVILTGFAIFQSTASPGQMVVSGSAQTLVSANETPVVSGDFNGNVELNWVLTGVYSDALPTPTPQPGGSTAPGYIGDLDLALRLEELDGNVSGYILLERALAFPHEHTVTIEAEELAIGPRVSGTFDGVTLRLESDRFEILLSPEQRLADGQLIPERRVTRQFSLTSTDVQNDGALLVGEYRETLWGFDIKPSTVIGEFALTRPVVVISIPTPSVDQKLFLPAILK